MSLRCLRESHQLVEGVFACWLAQEHARRQSWDVSSRVDDRVTASANVPGADSADDEPDYLII
jgi:hypothetical protein